MSQLSGLITLVVGLLLGLCLWLLVEIYQRKARDRQISADLEDLRGGSVDLLKRQVKALKDEVDAMKAGILLAGEEPTLSGVMVNSRANADPILVPMGVSDQDS